MDNIYNRIKLVRKESGLTQQAFAVKLGLKQNTIATYEMGKTMPSDRTISDICREFGVDEVWLRTGEGEMLRAASLADEISDYVAKILYDKDADLQRRIIALMARIPPELWPVLEEKAREVFGDNKEEEQK